MDVNFEEHYSFQQLPPPKWERPPFFEEVKGILHVYCAHSHHLPSPGPPRPSVVTTYPAWL